MDKGFLREEFDVCIYVGHVCGKLVLQNWSISVRLFSRFLKLFFVLIVGKWSVIFLVVGYLSSCYFSSRLS